MEMYVDLCFVLFRLYTAKNEPDMNFKSLLLRKCQKEFYRDTNSDDHDDFSSASLLIFDEEEIMYKRKIKKFGTIKLIGELFTRGCVPDVIIQECLNTLFSEIKDPNAESLCHFLECITRYLLFDPKRE